MEMRVEVKMRNEGTNREEIRNLKEGCQIQRTLVVFEFRARRKFKQVACTFPVFASTSTDLLAKNSAPPIKTVWKAFKTQICCFRNLF